MASKFTLRINLSNMATTQYCNYDFNSFCKIGDKYYGASDDGIFELTGKDDAGSNINAFFELPVSDFGVPNVKRIRTLYFGYEAKDDLTITVKDNEDNAREYTLRFIPTSYDKQTGGKVSVDRDGRGRYWGIRVDNVNGCFFAVNSIEAVFIVLGKKPR